MTLKSFGKKRKKNNLHSGILQDYVLEHCFAPDQALLEMHRIFKDDRKVVIEIPFEDTFDMNLIHGHSALFRNKEHAEKIFKEAGFHVVKKDFRRPKRNRFLLCKTIQED